MKILEGWDNFYVILGSAAAALIGLTFVVIALLSGARRANPSGLRGYITPTVVHFGTVLAFSAFMSVPHQTLRSLSIAFAIGGAGASIYSAVVARHVRRFTTDYVPVVADWVWHVFLPAFDYAALVGAAFLIWFRLQLALDCVAAALTMLLFIGIHNALDVAVSVTTGKQEGEARDTP